MYPSGAITTRNKLTARPHTDLNTCNEIHTPNRIFIKVIIIFIQHVAMVTSGVVTIAKKSLQRKSSLHQIFHPSTSPSPSVSWWSASWLATHWAAISHTSTDWKMTELKTPLEID